MLLQPALLFPKGSLSKARRNISQEILFSFIASQVLLRIIAFRGAIKLEQLFQWFILPNTYEEIINSSWFKLNLRLIWSHSSIEQN